MDKVTFEGRVSKMGEKLVIIVPSALKLMVRQGQKYRITLEPLQEQENPRPKRAIKAYLSDGEVRVGDHYTAEEIRDDMKRLGFLDDLWGWYKEVKDLKEVDAIAEELEKLGIDVSDLIYIPSGSPMVNKVKFDLRFGRLLNKLHVYVDRVLRAAREFYDRLTYSFIWLGYCSVHVGSC